MKYSIDTSAIIECWRRHYAPDVFPGVWAHLDSLIATGELRATEEVLHELVAKDDEIAAWAHAQPDLFVPIDATVQGKVAEILRAHPRLVDTRRDRSRADPFVIALAQLNDGCAVVTYESETYNPNKPTIPSVCRAMGTRFVRPIELFREQGWAMRR